MTKTRRLSFALAFLLIVASALTLRLRHLADRPMHNDEAVNTVKFRDLAINTPWRFEYDPHEYHGPALYYLTYPTWWMSGTPDYAGTTEWTYRTTTVIAGAWLVIMPMLLRRPLGSWGALWAAVLCACSPAMVYYSRYYIHEMILALFTFGAIVTGWRFSLRGRWRWAVGAGACLGMMAATKETWILHAAAAVMALALVWGYDRLRREEGMAGIHVGPGRVLAGMGVAVVVAVGVIVFMFSNLFRDFTAGGLVRFSGEQSVWAQSGLRDFARAYTTYFERGTGLEGAHNHPFGYYLEILWRYQGRKGARYVFSEWPILVLAAAGVILSLVLHARGPKRHRGAKRPKPEPYTGGAPAPAALAYGERATHRPPLAVTSPSIPFVRFMAFYTVLLTLIYSVISYKTPWCMVTFLHGMTVLGGFAVARLITWVPTRAGKGIVGAALMGGVGWVLVPQANLTSGITDASAQRMFSVHELNPYAYTPTTSMVISNTMWTIDKLAAARPDGYRGLVQVVGDNIWPLPFYLRRFERVGYYFAPPTKDATLSADLIIGPEELGRRLPHLLGQSLSALRAREKPLFVYAPPIVWERMLAERRGGPVPPLPTTLPSAATTRGVEPLTPSPTPSAGTPKPVPAPGGQK